MAGMGGLTAGAVAVLLMLGASPASAAPDIAVADASFGNVVVGTLSTQIVTVANTGSSDLQVDGFSFSGSGASQFSVTSDNCGPYPRTLAATASCTLEVGFQPTSRGTKAANLVVANSAGAGDNTAVLTGTGIAPVINADPTSLSFGEARLGTTTAAQTLTITNNGDAPLSVSGVSAIGANLSDFKIESNGCIGSPKTLQPGEWCALDIGFAPTSLGARTASIRVVSNDPAAPTWNVPLSGTGTDEALTFAPASLSFSDQIVGTTSAAMILVITNNGHLGGLVLSSLGVAGVNAGDFSVESNTCTPPKTVAPGENCTLGVRFTPSAVSTRSASIHVVSNAGESDAALAGAGIAVPTPSDTGGSTSQEGGGSTPPPTAITAPPSTIAPSVSCVVPKLKGKTLAAVKRALRRAHCRLSRVIRVRSRHRPGRVLRQSRKPGTRLPQGARVAVVLARR